jgi:4-hydroxy-3-methylbut-2-enyl diphosphate reductase IspH
MRIRYEYIHKLKDADLLIIIGDQRSNNVKQLVDFAKHYQINTKLITSVADVEPSIFQNINNLVIASGTSIHPECTQAIIKKIKTIAK